MKVGDYARSSEGDFGKIKSIDNLTNEIEIEDSWMMYEKEDLKTSPRIIDLIVENDYINGLRVEKNKYGDLYTSYVYYGGDIGKQCEVYTNWLKDYEEKDFKSIVTKEKFESMQYNLESEVN